MKLCRCGCGVAVTGNRVFVNQEHRLRSIYGTGPAKQCKCGCGQQTKGRKVFVNREHMLNWMNRGGAGQMNAQQPREAKARGGHTAGTQTVASGRLEAMSQKGAARNREIAAQFHAARAQSELPPSTGDGNG